MGKAQGHDQQTVQGGDDQCRMDTSAQAIIVPGPLAPGNNGVDAVAHADEQSREQRHHNGAGTHAAQSMRARKPAHDGHVGHIEKDLQNVGKNQRYAEYPDIFR